MVDRKIINKTIVFVLIGILILLAIFLLRPILLAIFIGVFLAYILLPLYSRVRRKIKAPNIATFVFIFALILVIGIPLWILLPKFLREIFDTYLYIQKIDLSGAIGEILDLLFSPEIARIFAVQINLLIAKIFSFSLESFGASFSDFPSLALQFLVFIFTFYYALRDSEKIKEYLSELSPLSKSTEAKFAAEFRNITNSIVFGQIFIGLVQGISLGLGLWLLGVPKVLFITTVAVILSIIPLFGAWLVWVPVSLYLIVTGHVLNGTILFFYGLLFVSILDNILRPYIISRQSNLNIFVAIIGIVGGLYSFGIIGLILGPLILSYLVIVIDFYRQGKLNELFRE